jgi:membrane-associated phospholipid phosphatase
MVGIVVIIGLPTAVRVLVYQRLTIFYSAFILFSCAAVSYYFFDLAIAQWVAENTAMLSRYPFKSVSLLGLAIYPFIALVLMAVISRWRGNKLYYEFALVCILAIAFSGIICDIIKIIVGRARPLAYFEHQQFGFLWLQLRAKYWSFPSGHTTTTFAMFTIASYYFPKWRLFFASSAITVALSRIALNKHYLSDVMIGAFLGTTASMLLFHVLLHSEFGARITRQLRL